ncbi:hypothetical protein [Pedobacter frigoris]|uniref:Uncharacterized protein n=1 Tax=Pedobacter frigoris TaxID=2571272 RepID=A0A4V5NYA0_9SPHI|nr:hypothetical protein [Pedobacter frigoris]TKC02854.1 hypothetical protein FA047_20080 [Pedobacter frigoris]
MMNNTFNLSRFIKLFKRHSIANYKPYLMLLLILIGGLSIALGYTSMNANSFISIEQYTMFQLCLFVSAPIFTAGIFAELGSQSKSISFLMLPASNLEKWLVAWVYSFVIFLVVYIACFYVVDAVVLQIANASLKQPQKLVNIFDPKHRLISDLVIFSLLHALSFFGAVFFRKHQILKIGSLLLVLYFGMIYVNAAVLTAMFNTEVNVGQLFSSVSFIDGNDYYHINESPIISSASSYIFFIVAGLIWSATYYRLKEKEV